VYAQLLVGPVEGGTEAEVARIFWSTPDLHI
jgi:hypothetical protein